MSELTKQYFDKQLSKLATKEEIAKLATKEELKKLTTKEDLRRFATKEDLKSELGSLESRLESKIEEEVADLARMTNNGLEEIKRELDVKKDVDQLKIQMSKVWHDLNVKS